MQTFQKRCWPVPEAAIRLPDPLSVLTLESSKELVGLPDRDHDRPTALLPFRDGTIFVENSGHGAGTAERVLSKRRLIQLKSQTRFLGQWEPSIHHPHGREAQPLLPDLIVGAGLDL